MGKRKFAQIFKTKQEGISLAKKHLKKVKFVSGIRGGKIPSKKAKIYTKKIGGGFVVYARR